MDNTCSPCRAIALLVLISLAFAMPAPAAASPPRVPEHDALVLETLPRTLGRDGELARLRRRLAETPGDRSLAVDVAWRLLQEARRSGDPRFHGYAQAALRPWWSQSPAPTDVTLLRATLLQNRHDFDAALRDLRSLTARDPRNARAWLTRATVESVMGEPALAVKSCARLRSISPPLVSTACSAHATSLMGEADRAYQRLARALRRTQASPATRAWALGILAEIAVMRGDPAAQDLFREALQRDPDDRYLRNALADLYLDLGDTAAALEALGEDRDSDGALLRRALAAAATGDDGAKALTERLARRYRALSNRGDSVHLAEAARFELHLRGNAARALTLAISNWRTQREPRDARILLEASLAAGRPAAATPVLEWLQRTGLEDVVLRRLVARTGERI